VPRPVGVALLNRFAVDSLDHRSDVEGTRGVAVLAVVCFHAGLVGGGYIGVDVFFVLSGFLITRLLSDEIARTQAVSFASFYARRARRLLPASALVLVATVAASAMWLSPLRAHSVVQDGKAAALYVSNYRFAAQRTDYLSSQAPSPLQHYWSLSVEEQFYALWPLVLLGLSRLARRARQPAAALTGALLLIGIASFALSVHLTTASQPWAFFSLPTRAWELIGGALVARAAQRFRHLRASVAAGLGWIGLVAIAYAVFRFSSSTPFPGTAAAIPVFGTVALLLAGCAAPERGPRVLLDHPSLQFLGRISYAWYLWHWPVLVIAPEITGHPLPRALAVVLAAASGVLAWGTVELIERPIRFASLLAVPRRSLALGASLTAIALAAMVVTSGAIPSVRGHGNAVTLQPRLGNIAKPTSASAVKHTPVSPQVAAVAAGVATKGVPANLDPGLEHAAADKAEPFNDGCMDSFTDAQVRHCAYANRQSPTTIVLFGDSHATQYFPTLDTIAVLRGWRLVVITKATCPPFQLSIRSPVLGRAFRECDQWRAAAFDRIASEHPALVVMGVARHYEASYGFNVFGPEWITALKTSVQRVRASGAAVVVLGPTPKPPFDVPGCLSSHIFDATACTFPFAQAVNAQGRALERAATVASGGSYVDVAPYICTSSTCAAIIGNLLVFRDDNHLSTTFTKWIAPAIVTELDAARKVSSRTG
jgi:peptidoglycan/LPS O-acetylase OafA/YrhL